MSGTFKLPMELWHGECIKGQPALLTRLLFLFAASFLAFISSVYLIRRSYNEGLLLRVEGEQPQGNHINETVSRLSNETNVITELPNGNCTKQIAVITPNLGDIWQFGQTKSLFRLENGIRQLNLTCPEQGYNVTVGIIWSNRDFLRESDGVFHIYRRDWTLDHVLTELKAAGGEDTTLIFYNMESPLKTLFHKSAALYGIDVTYYSHSTLTSPYGYYDPSEPTDKIPVKNWARNKTHIIVWMASNCKPAWPRTEFVRNLSNYIPVDMYGKCGDLSCPKDQKEECRLKMKQYKFYLALENSECDEYITEKFWSNALSYGIVPVVYGGRRAAYERVAPPNSFIHVADFSSTKELADYLLKLDKNDTKYNDFFHWRLHGRVVYLPPSGQFLNIFCKLTPLLSTYKNQIKRKVSESDYFNSCRGRASSYLGSYTLPSLETWKLWK